MRTLFTHMPDLISTTVTNSQHEKVTIILWIRIAKVNFEWGHDDQLLTVDK